MGFERCHPAVNFLYFAAVLLGTVFFQHPIFLLISFGSAFAYSIKRNGMKALVFNLAALPFVIAFALYYSSYTHFGVTVLEVNRIGNNMTLESLVYGFVLGFNSATADVVEYNAYPTGFEMTPTDTDRVEYMNSNVGPLGFTDFKREQYFAPTDSGCLFCFQSIVLLYFPPYETITSSYTTAKFGLRVRTK